MTSFELRDAVMACWYGKSIGGTLGAPFECKRGVCDLEYYTQELNGEPLPNDDLDLQLVWLNAAENCGPSINSHILAEYWLSYIVPNWGEYGAGKNNLRQRILPPLSGIVNNAFGNSNGAFILTEIWACLSPGRPDVAIRYAFEDSSVNHSGEGVYAAIFIAAIESAAFIEKDKNKLIEIGLSFIPEDCGIRRAVDCVLNSYKCKDDWKAARKKLFQTVPGSFGVLMTPSSKIPDDEPIGDIGYDAPSNIGIIIIGWLYGEDDFSKSICIATGCGEDADCTAGTLGAIMGIVGGMKNIPEKWIKPIGNKIKTMCINNCDQGLSIPETVDELTDRVINLIPRFLPDSVSFPNGYTVSVEEKNDFLCKPKRVNAFAQRDVRELIFNPYLLHYQNHIMDVKIDLHGEPMISNDHPMTVTVSIENLIYSQQWVEIIWTLPDGIKILPGCYINAPIEQYHCNIGILNKDFVIESDDNFSGGFIKLDVHYQDRLGSVHAEIPIFKNS